MNRHNKAVERMRYRAPLTVDVGRQRGSETAMIINEQNLAWLLEDDEPSIQYRTLTELLGLGADDTRVRRARERIPASPAVELLFSAMEPDGSWQYEYRGQVNRYFKYLSATLSYAAELGLNTSDERVPRAVEHLFSMQKADGDFYRHYSCYNGLLLRSLNRLGFGSDEGTCHLRRLVLASIRHDGGYHCDFRPRRGWNAPTPHKSCFKGSLKSLLAFSEDPELSQTDECKRLAKYFLKRRLLFRTDAPDVPVTRDLKPSFPITYHPGLVEPLYALSLLGYGQCQELQDAWVILLKRTDGNGRLRLEKSVPWSHLRCGTRRRENKWLTLYAGIVEKQRCENPILGQPSVAGDA
jgi:hypothetical protein